MATAQAQSPQPLALGATPPTVLAVCVLDIMAWVLLKPWLAGLRAAGCEVHVACSRGRYFDRLAGEGFHMHEVHLSRKLRPWVHIRPIFELRRLIAKGKFDVINTHGPIAACDGRLAARLARGRMIIYTVHGFYFHENMPALSRWPVIVAEWILGRFTDHFMFVSDEDHRTARRLGIAGTRSSTTTIRNGVDTDAFVPREQNPDEAEAARRELGIEPGTPVVGFVGRIVREKGCREFLRMARKIAERRRAVFLIVGDTFPSDRDQFGGSFRRQVRDSGLAPHFRFTGLTDQVARYLCAMDIFTLPSYREGLPRSVIEAMSAGLPAVVTNIRGCREAVVHGETGLVVPPRDGEALTRAVEYLIDNPDAAGRMGRAARKRAIELYDWRNVQRHFVDFVIQAHEARKAAQHGQTGGPTP
ncbi:MAG: glycosyltransferase family 4 protein [Bryobacteraceae bacterium]